MKNKLLKILTFICVTLMALVMLAIKINPELVMILPIMKEIYAFIKEIYVAINEIIPLDRGDEINLLTIFAALIMPIFAGIMRSISNCNPSGIIAVAGFFIFAAACFFIGGVVTIFFGAILIFVLFKASIISLAISYIFCCGLIFSEEEPCNCDCDICDCNVCCIGECY